MESEKQVKFIDVMYAGDVIQEGDVGVVRSGDEVPQQLCILQASPGQTSSCLRHFFLGVSVK